MKRFWFLILTGLLVLLAGCSAQDGDSLLVAPRPTKDYQALQDELDQITASGAVAAVPAGGENRYAVQLTDLDGDGVEEAVAFFQTTASGNTFEAVIFAKEEEGSYVRRGSVQGTGVGIEMVEFPQIDADGRRAIQIAWQMPGEAAYALTMADYVDGEVRTLLETTCAHFMAADLDGDKAQELLTVTSEGGALRQARLYEYRAGVRTVELVGERAVSAGARAITRMETGYIADRTPAVFAEEKLESGAGQQTDIFVYDAETGLRNLALDTESGIERGTYRPVAVGATDINSDGLTEIPRAVRMAGYDGDATDATYMIDWYLYSAAEAPAYVMTTYRNVSQNWDFTFSEAWRDSVSAVKGVENTNEYTCFVEYRPEGSIPLLTIYFFLGATWEDYAGHEELFLLQETSSGVLAAHIPATASQSTLAVSEEEVQRNFHMVAPEWTQN